MARRKSSYQTMKKVEPAVQKLYIKIEPGTVEAPEQFIDLSQCASIVNRRFYRQGLNWAVRGFRVGYTADGGVTICKLQNTWSTGGAWEKTFRLWKKQQDDALEDSDSGNMAARFRDFKIHMNAAHVTAGFSSNLIPIDCNADEFMTGEWLASQVVIPNHAAPGVTQEFYLQMNGPDAGTGKGMIQGYTESRNLPVSPDPTSLPGGVHESFLQSMFDVGNDSTEVTNNAQFRNNDLPYDQNDYPGGSTNAVGLQYHSQVIFSVNGNNGFGNFLRMEGGNFPCGLISVVNNTTGDIYLEVDLVPGPHRGYLASPMEDF